MKPATLSELKKELKTLSPEAVAELCLRMAKYKKENKELLTYLLFEAGDEQEYIKNVQQQMDDEFAEMNRHNAYLAKKTIRKVLRTANRHIKFSGNKQTEAELLIYFCKKLKTSGLNFKRYLVLSNLYDRQLQKIQKAISTLHEDLQYDYEKEIKGL